MQVCGSKAGNMNNESIETCQCIDCRERTFINDWNWDEPISNDVPMEWVYEKFKARYLEEKTCD